MRKASVFPFTIADYDRDKGTVTVIFQIVGKSTESLNELGEGDSLQDMVGPLGVASNFEGVKSCCYRRRFRYRHCVSAGKKASFYGHFCRYD